MRGAPGCQRGSLWGRDTGWGPEPAVVGTRAAAPHAGALQPCRAPGDAACASPQVVHAHKPHFMALHCQEFGGKNYEASMSHVDKFVK